MRQDQRRRRQRLRRRAERAALPRAADGSDHPARHADAETVGLEPADDGLPLADRRGLRQPLRVPFEADQGRLSVFEVQFQGLRAAVRVSGLRADAHPVDASGAELSPSVSAAELGRGAVEAGGREQSLLFVPGGVSIRAAERGVGEDARGQGDEHE